MVADLELSGEDSMDLVIENMGRALARHVTVNFIPPLPTAQTSSDGQPSVIPLLRTRYASPVSSWAPGKRLRSSFWSRSNATDHHGEHLDVNGLSRETVVSLEYLDEDGNGYRDSYSLDLSAMEGETWTVHKQTQNGETTVLKDGAPWLNH